MMVRGEGLLPGVQLGLLDGLEPGCGELGRLRLRWLSGRLLGGDVLPSPMVADMGGLLASGVMPVGVGPGFRGRWRRPGWPGGRS